MSTAVAAARSVRRFSPACRGLANETGPASFTFRVGTRSPPASILVSRSISSCTISLLPYHTATSSALINSKLSVSSCAYLWTLDGP